MRLATQRHLADASVAAIVAGVLYASLARHAGVDCSRFAHALLRESYGMSGADMVGNVLAYALLGAAIRFARDVRHPASGLAAGMRAGLLAVAGCALLSMSMEAAQACLEDRASSWLDWVWNVCGAALGWVVVPAGRHGWARCVRDGEPGRLRAVALLASAAWLVGTTAPWFPAPDPAVWRARLDVAWYALAGGHLDPWRLSQRAGEWIALGATLALVLPFRRERLGVLPLAALATIESGWRVVLRHAPLLPAAPAESLAAVPLALLGVFVTLGRRRALAWLALAGLLVALVASQLQPLPGGEPVPAFRWELDLLRGNALVGLRDACWIAWLAASAVVAGRSLGGSPWAWVAPPVVLAFATEWLQTRIPGQVPELSMPVVAFGCGVLAAAMITGGGFRSASGAPTTSAAR